MRHSAPEGTTRRTPGPAALAIVVLPALLAACTAERGRASQEPSTRAFLVPAGLEFPYRVEPACPGEGCAYGTWLVCDSVPLFRAAGDSTVDGHLLPGEAFEVTTGAVIVDVPEVVVVTRPARQYSFLEGGLTFAPGDTLWVLDYLGEGFFNVWFADSVFEVDVFWPWANFYPADDFEYGGEVIQNGRTSFWVHAVGPGERVGWVRVDGAAVAAPSSLDPDPPMCRTPN